MITTRPVMRYHGGKWKLAPWIIENLPPHRVYVEPFGGAASVLLRKPRSYAEVYNDLDGEVVNLFRVLRDPSQARELKRLLILTPFARQEYELSQITASDPIEQARRTVFRSFAGFASTAASGNATGFRANSNRSGTTPAHDWRNFPDALDAIIDRLRGVVIEMRNADEVIRQHDSVKTLFYVDPPYVHETRYSDAARRAYRYEMTDGEHRQLSETLHDVAGMVVLSGYQSALYDELYVGWTKIQRKAFTDSVTERTEVLWLNRAASDAREIPVQIVMPI